MKRKVALVALAVLALVACITVNVYFPEQAIKDLSQQIEAQVQQQAGGSTTPAPPSPTPAAVGAGRLAALNGWKSRGVIGENSQALVEVRSLDAVPGLKERADVQRLVKDENA